MTTLSIVGTINCLFCVCFYNGDSISFREPNQMKWLYPRFLEDFIWPQSVWSSSSIYDQVDNHRARKRRTDKNNSSTRSRFADVSKSADSAVLADTETALPTNFSAALAEHALPLPPALARKLHVKEVNGLGKVSEYIPY